MRPEAKTPSITKRPKRRGLPLWHRRWVRAGVFGAAIFAVAGAGAWMWRAGHIEVLQSEAKSRSIALSSRLGFNIRDILVSGRHETTRSALLDALDLRRGVPILAFDPDGVRQRVEALPWVREATVERRLPDGVFVDIHERHPLALWQRDGRHHLIDVEGVVISAADVPRFGHLPLIVGDDAPIHASALLHDLSREDDLAGAVRAAVRIGKRRWDVVLITGTKVRLPEIDQVGAWSRLAAYQREHDLLSRDVGIIDLRVPDRLVLRLRDGGETGQAVAQKIARGT